MNIKETNEFINNYIENYKPKSAIMLNGPWGIGKSYYIKNELAKNIKRECVIISLYGLENLNELSRKIYLEINTKTKNVESENNRPRTEKDKKKNYKNTEKKVNIEKYKFAGKTIVQGILSLCNIDLKLDEKHINKLFESVNLTNKLLILEDVERTSIDIKEILGYVSNLVEYDDVKVMLVANENEFFKESENGKKEEYRKQKEKTIGDTILFIPFLKDPIQKIYDSFDDKNLKEIKNKYTDIFDEIENEIIYANGIKNPNLRLVMYAIQKTTEMLRDLELDINFKKIILMSNIAYTLRKPNLKNDVWVFDNKSPIFGTHDYPLYKFSYDYLNYHFLDKNEIILENKKYNEYLKITNRQNNLKNYLDTIYTYYNHSDKELLEAMNKVKQNLIENEDINYVEYPDIAMYLIELKRILNCEDLVESCKKIMLENIKKVKDGKKIDLFRFIMNEESESKEETLNFIRQLNIILEKKTEVNVTKYKDIESKCEEVIKHKELYYNKRKFSSLVDNDIIIEQLKRSTAKEISSIRGMYIEIYNPVGIKNYLLNDLDSIKDLRKKLDSIRDDKDTFDTIKRLQLKWFSENLDDIIERLNK